jgi:NAD-dependent dihydropyrimidine dehydrogenase PreA subunit
LINKIDAARCTGCGICVNRCNMDVLRLDTAAGKAFIAYHEDCMTCFECALSCPEDAVEVTYTPEFTPSSIVYPEGDRKRD